MQEDPPSLRQWEANWQMKFNVSKCRSMRVTRHQHHKQILFDYSLHNQTLENVQSAKIVSEYDQEIPQSQTADNPVAPRGRAAQPSQDTRKTN